MNEKYYGNYLGLCIQNNDPETRGRVKIWVPHISATIYEGLNKKQKDLAVIFPDKKLTPEFIDILKELKLILPWAECASPLFGGDGTMRFNAPDENAVPTDSASLEEGHGAGAETTSANSRFRNFFKRSPASGVVTSAAPKHRGKARGLFTVPNVGAHLWVFYREGNPNSPVYFAASHGEEDWKGIYEPSPATDYPGEYENKSIEDGGSVENKDGRTFRAKTVLNSNKHTIELIDTDNHEILKMTHFNGSFQEFNNTARLQLITNIDQLDVLGDQFVSIRKDKNVHVGGDYNIITEGAFINQIGITDQEKVKNIVERLKELHNYKRLFDIKRADYGDIGPQQLSNEQKRQGTFAVCPVCENKAYIPSDQWDSNALARATPIYTPITTGSGFGRANFQIMFTPDPLTKAAAQFTGQRGYHMDSQCDVCNSINTIHLPNGHTGPGFSPSTEDGIWQLDMDKRDKIQQWIKNNTKDMAELERHLGNSDHIVTISKNKIETIGLVMNDIPSIRTDPFGRLRIDGVHTAPEGTYSTYKPVPLVEYVDVDDIPGGDYNLTVTNKYKLLVGARGINIKTFGPIDMYGTIVNLVGEEINMVSQNSVSIDGGERLTLRGRVISISPYEHNPLVIDGQLHVTRNTIIQGATMIEGELGVTHITAPSQYYETLQSTPGATESNGPLMTELGYGPIPHMHSVQPHTHAIPPHTHHFINLPMNLLKTPIEVRSKMVTMGVNSVDSVQPGGKIGGVGNTTVLGENVFDVPGVEQLGKNYLGPDHLTRINGGEDWGGPVKACIDVIEDDIEDVGQIVGEQITEDEILYSCYFGRDAGDGVSQLPNGIRVNVLYKISTVNIFGRDLLAIDNESWRYYHTLSTTGDKIKAEMAKRSATQKILKIEKAGEPDIHIMKLQTNIEVG